MTLSSQKLISVGTNPVQKTDTICRKLITKFGTKTTRNGTSKVITTTIITNVQ